MPQPPSPAPAPAVAPPTLRAAAPRPASPTPTPAAPPAPATLADTWRRMFQDWPTAIPRRGIVVNSLNEPLPFKGFLLRGDVLLLQRTNPDSLGARFLLIPYSEIALVKLTDPLDQSVFDAAGYEGKLAN